MLPALPAFELGRVPRIRFGEGSGKVLPDILARHGDRALAVTGRRSFDDSPLSSWLGPALSERGVELVDRIVITAEPSPDDVDGAVARHRASGIRVVVGIGGGSVLDAAKAIAGLLPVGTSVRDHLEGVGPQLPYAGPALPWVAVPTTAGTGSEATRNAVITQRGEGGFKRSFRHELLVASDAVVDPDLLAGLGPELIATNGMDALTQLLESYVSVRASPLTDALALAGLEAARDGLLAWHADPDGPGAPAARSRMALAALLSGICLAHAGLGAVHGLASPLGAFFPVPHGAACGALLAAATAVNIKALEERLPGSPALARYTTAGRLLARLATPMADAEARTALLELLSDWTERLRIPRLSTFGIGASDLPRLLADARGGSMRTNPVELTDAELTRLLDDSL